MSYEYDFDQMARDWSKIRAAFHQCLKGGTESAKKQRHQKLMSLLQSFFLSYPNPFGEDEEFVPPGLHEAEVLSWEEAERKMRLEKAKALLADINKTIQVLKQQDSDPVELRKWAEYRKKALSKVRRYEHWGTGGGQEGY